MNAANIKAIVAIIGVLTLVGLGVLPWGGIAALIVGLVMDKPTLPTLGGGGTEAP